MRFSTLRKPELSSCFNESCSEPCCYCVLEHYRASLLVVSWVSRIKELYDLQQIPQI